MSEYKGRPTVKLPVPGISQEMIDAGYAAWGRAADFIYRDDDQMTDEIIVMIYQAMEERRLADAEGASHERSQAKP